MKRGLLVLLILLVGLWGRTTHIIGGELYYDCLGNDQYRITLKVYRDCYLGQAPFDDPVSISVYTPGGTHIQNISISFPGSTNVPFVGNNPCFQAPPNVCVEVAVYSKIVTLPPSPLGYVLAYQRCCRNNSIINLVNPQATGATYSETIPPSTQISCNNSPRFTNFPPIAICIGDTLVFDHSATDADGDSLVYTLCTTNAGATQANPMPATTSPPPFPLINFAPPYSANYPIATNPPVTLDPQTGLLVVTPSVTGQYVVGVCAQEYRNGVLIGTHSRDFQFNVTNCLTNTIADFDVPPDFKPDGSGVLFRCGDYNIPFINNSQNASQYLWNFGDPTTTNDFSTLNNPSYNYPDSGLYTVTLIANPGYFCADTASIDIKIKPLLDIDFVAPPAQCIDGNLFLLDADGIFGANVNFTWDFPGGTPPTGTGETPTVSYGSGGAFLVTLYAEEAGCYDTAKKFLVVYDHPIPDITIPTTGCAPQTVTFQNNTIYNGNTLVYNWTFGNGETSNLPSPTTTYQFPGVYSISLVITSTTGCMDVFNFNYPNGLIVYPSPTAGFIVDPLEASIFSPTFQFVDQSFNNISCWLYFDNGDSTDACSTIYTYADTGHYTTYQVVLNEFGCPDTFFQKIVVKPEFAYYVPNTFTVNGDGINETFRGYGIGIDELEFRIYDRWGGVLFFTKDQFEAWDGTFRNEGKAVPAGVYVWAADVRDVFGKDHLLRGKVLLLRKASEH